MASSTSDTSGNAPRDLIGEWNLAEESGAKPGEVDSLLAFTEARNRAWAPAGSHLDAPSEPSTRDADADLVGAFSIGEDVDEDDSLLAGPGSGRQVAKSSVKPDGAPPMALPGPGDEIGGFVIVGELGRGAFARVFLAKQESLGHRLVALKVSKAEGDEPQILARLQHTHIVPIHSVHDDPKTGLRLMCMPFLGGANLAQVLEAAGTRISSHATGRSLVEALDVVSHRLQSVNGLDYPSFTFVSARVAPNDLTLVPHSECGPTSSRSLSHSFMGRSVSRVSERSTSAIQSLWTRISGRSRMSFEGAPRLEEQEVDQPSRQFLREANAIQAAVWIVARLAEGLDHAHCRGLLHRDLKPSNVLIADDGTPMLLDFNLATLSRIQASDEGTKAILGGTLPYMAPEHLDAFHPKGTTLPEAVREQADLYALGLILFEIVAGEHPFAEPPPALPLSDIIQLMLEDRRRVPSLRAACPDVPWSLDAVVARCLDPDPSRRYHRARDLAEDLRRFLEDLPLKYTPEPSLRERLAKWFRRNPSVTSMTSVVMLSLVLILASGGVISFLSNTLQTFSAKLRFREFESVFSECQLRLNTTSGPDSHLREGINKAQKALEQDGAGLWTEQGKNGWTRRLPPGDRKIFLEQMVELILLEARARTYLAGTKGSEADQRVALEWAVEWLNRAEKIDPRKTPALYGDRARYLAALGEADRAALDRKREAATEPVNSRDYALLGTSFMVKRDWPRAEAALLRSVALDKRRFWSWFALGFCRFEQGRYLEAAGNFSVCTALQPEFSWPYMNQGLALAWAGRLDEALSAYDQALEKNPYFIEALVNRALTRLELRDHVRAGDDLNRAIKLGCTEPGVLAALGEVLSRSGRHADAEQLYGDLLKKDPDNASFRIARAVLRLKVDPEGAREDLARVLDRDPRNARALYVMAKLLAAKDPQAALGLVDTALEVDPNLGDALQFRALHRARLGNLAAMDDVQRLIEAPTATHLYNAACALALLAETDPEHRLSDRALSLLERAIEVGYPQASAAADADLKILRTSPKFQALIRKKVMGQPRS